MARVPSSGDNTKLKIIISLRTGKIKRKCGKMPRFHLDKNIKDRTGAMSYTKVTTRTKRGNIIAEYHNAKYGAPGQARVKKKKPTPEQVEKQNQWNRERKVRIRLLEYFGEDDYFSTWTYRKEERPPDMETARQHFAAARKYIRKEYKKRGQELRWIRNIEVGTKGAWHIHVVINRIPDTDLILKAAWQHGKIVNQLTYEKGGFRELAAYMVKTPKTDPRLKEADYSISRNMPLPEPERKVYRHWRTWKDIREPKGYYLDKNSVREGINPVTGYPYRTYVLLKLEKGGNRVGG